MNEDQKITSNFYFAAALLASGAVLVDTDRSNERHVKFVLERGDNCVSLDDLEVAWDNKSLEVNAREYADAISQMKMKLYQD